jgi:hypothetical protein
MVELSGTARAARKKQTRSRTAAGSGRKYRIRFALMVELSGIEPLTSSLRTHRSMIPCESAAFRKRYESIICVDRMSPEE